MNLELDYELFDPHLGEIDPLQPWGPRLCNIAYRARRILARRSREEIREASMALSWIFDCFLAEGYPDMEKEDEVRVAPNPAMHQWLEENYYSEVAELWHRHRQIDIDGMQGFDKAAWSELFAVVALSIVASHQINRNRLSELGVSSEKAGRSLLRDIDVVHAMEAICYADSLDRQEVTINNLAEELAVRQLKLRNAKAAYARHAKAQLIKKRFIEFLAKRANRSKRDMACRFYRALTEDEQLAICPSRDEENAIRTLTSAARKPAE